MGARLKGKVAVVTGGGHGIGKACAEALARKGARVAVADLDLAAAQRVAKSIRTRGGKADAVRVDVKEESSVEALAAHAARACGRIDILLNNAAVHAGLTKKPWDKITGGEWDQVLGVNLKGCFLCARAAVPFMRKGSKIINMSSGSVWRPPSGGLHYVASKAGVLGLTKALARELGGRGITVNAVTPGLTRTERPGAWEAAHEAVAAGRCLKRVQLPADIIGTVLFLASAGSDFLTGQTINVDGGYAFPN